MVPFRSNRRRSKASACVRFTGRTRKNYAAGGTRHPMTLSAVKFLRRFLLHVLPKGFVRIRRCGWWTNRHGQRQLDRAVTCCALRRPPSRQRGKPISRFLRQCLRRPHAAPGAGKGTGCWWSKPLVPRAGNWSAACRCGRTPHERGTGWIPRSLPCRASSSATARLVLCADHALRAFPSACSLQIAHCAAGQHHPDSPRDLPPHRAAD